MLNQCILVGKLVEISAKSTIIKVLTNHGEEPHVVPVNLPTKLHNTVFESMDTGSHIGIKGYLKGNNDLCHVEADKVTFLSTTFTDDEVPEGQTTIYDYV